MTKEEIAKAYKVFVDYQESIFSLDTDIKFWKSFMDISVKNYVNLNYAESQMFAAIFSVYDINCKTNIGYLKTHNKSKTYLVKDLNEHKEEFFNWVINLSLLKAYNSLELLLLNSIRQKYFQNIDFPENSKKAIAKTNQLIKHFLKENNLSHDSTNNNHIILFLKSRCIDYELFLNCLTRIDSKTNWESFFCLISILRNVVAHNAMVVNNDILNQIRSKAEDRFKSHFYLDKNNLLIPIKDQFNNFLIFVNDFAVNSMKLIFEQNDLSFINLKN